LPDLAFKDLCEEGTLYLIPKTDADIKNWLRWNFVARFEHEIDAGHH